MMPDSNHLVLSADLMSKISGGGWQESTLGYIANFKSLSDEELASEGLSRNCESMLIVMEAEFEDSGVPYAEREVVRQFIRQNYDSVPAAR